MAISPPPQDLVNAPTRVRVAWYADVARLAPSKHNSQPWHFLVHDDALEVHAETARRLPASDPRGRELRISCGAAVRAAEVAAAALGIDTAVSLFDAGDDGCLAEIRETGIRIPEPHDHDLLTAVTRRRTDRGPLDISVLDPALPFRLQNIAAGLGCVFQLVSSPGDRQTLARAVEIAHGMVLHEPQIEAELANWIRTPDDTRRDGVPSTATRGPASSYRATFVQRDFSTPGSPAAHDRTGRDDPLIGILCTPADSRVDWLRCGRGLMAVLLEATAAGANASYLNQPLELQRTRDLLRAELVLPGAPQLILRIGAGAPVPATARLPQDQVISQA
jgi:hypothetical protein